MSKSSDLKKLARNQWALKVLSQTPVSLDGINPAEWVFGDIALDLLEKLVKQYQEFSAQFFDWVGPVDGWPGTKFYCALWQSYLSNLSRETLVERAAWFAAHTSAVPYVLGGGSTGWFEPGPSPQGLDCSAFVALLLGRAKSGGPDWVNSKGDYMWLHTGSIYSDAKGPQVLFREVSEPRLGSIFVYPDNGGKQGHTGLVIGGDLPSGKLAVIDCSSSSSRNWSGDAIRMHTSGVGQRDDTIYVEPVWWSLGTR